MTVFEAFIGAAVVIAVAKVISYLRYRRQIKKMAADFEKQMIESFMSVILPVKAERHDDVIYFYKADSMEYLCHGKTRQELADAVEAKCPGMTVFVQDDCDGEILKALEIH
jgi:hypothetical protein